MSRHFRRIGATGATASTKSAGATRLGRDDGGRMPVNRYDRDGPHNPARRSVPGAYRASSVAQIGTPSSWNLAALHRRSPGRRGHRRLADAAEP